MKVLKVIRGCILISLHKTENFDKFILEYLTTPQSIIFSHNFGVTVMSIYFPLQYLYLIENKWCGE